jgi:hypothetical protein
MTPGEQAFWSLPGPARFVAEVVGQVLSADRGIVGIALPRRMPPGAIDALREALLDRGGGRVVRVRATDRMFERSIAHGLAYFAGARDGSIRTVAALAESDAASATTFVVEGIRAADWPRWGAFLRSFAVASTDADRSLAPVVAVCRPTGLPDSAVARLFDRDEVAWRGRVSPLDMRMHVGTLRGHGGRETLIEKIAAETVVRLAMWDPVVAAGFAELDARRLVDPEAMVRAAAGSGSDDAPSWENGLVDVWDGRPALHLAGCRDAVGAREIRRRSWAAQAEHVLPFVDDVRGFFADRYGKLLAAALPQTVQRRGGSVQVTEPTDLEIAPIWRILEQAIPPAEEAFLRAVVAMRNLVAHHQTVSVDVLEKVSQAWERLRVERESVPGWAWPRCGQRLEFVAERASGHAMRIDPAQPRMIGLEALIRRVHARLGSGEDAVVDGSNLSGAERDRIAAVVPHDIEVVGAAAAGGEREAA